MEVALEHSQLAITIAEQADDGMEEASAVAARSMAMFYRDKYACSAVSVFRDCNVVFCVCFRCWFIYDSHHNVTHYCFQYRYIAL